MPESTAISQEAAHTTTPNRLKRTREANPKFPTRKKQAIRICTTEGCTYTQDIKSKTGLCRDCYDELLNDCKVRRNTSCDDMNRVPTADNVREHKSSSPKRQKHPSPKAKIKRQKGSKSSPHKVHKKPSSPKAKTRQRKCYTKGCEKLVLFQLRGIGMCNDCYGKKLVGLKQKKNGKKEKKADENTVEGNRLGSGDLPTKLHHEEAQSTKNEMTNAVLVSHHKKEETVPARSMNACPETKEKATAPEKAVSATSGTETKSKGCVIS